MATEGPAERGRAEPIDVEFEPARSHGSGGIGVTSALVLAVLSAGAGAAGGAIAPRVPQLNTLLNQAAPDVASTQVAAQAAQQRADLAAISNRLQALEAVMNTPLDQAANAGPDGANLGQRVFVLQSGLRDVQTRLSQLPSSQQVTELVTQVQTLQQDVPGIAAQARAAEQAARAAYAVAAAAEASRTSGPFEEQLQALQVLLPNDQNVAALEPLARTGAPTLPQLRDRFAQTDDDIIRAARVAQAGAGFWGRIQAQLAQWIVVRPPGAGDTPDGAVERAEQHLAADDLRGAIHELSGLSGPARQAATPWLTDAQRRLDIDTRLAAIRQELSRGT